VSVSAHLPDARARVNGLSVDPHGPTLSLFDRGFLYGDGVFEVLRTYDGRPTTLEDHLARMNTSAAALGIPMGVPNARWISEVHDALRESPWTESTVRLIVTRGVAAPGVAPPRAASPTRVVLVTAFAPRPPLASCGVAAITLRGPRAARAGVSAGHKTLEYLTSVLALREALGAGAEEAILLDGGGGVVEGATSNVFVVEGDRVRTTLDDGAALPGVTQRFALEAARAEGFSVSRASLTEADLWTADEVFLTSSVREVTPVLRVDDHEVGSGTVGEGTARIHRRLRDLLRAR
jgi:branched-chain amino acid aminotransferase